MKTVLKRDILDYKKKIYNSLTETIKKNMQGCYEGNKIYRYIAVSIIIYITLLHYITFIIIVVKHSVRQQFSVLL